MSAARRLDPAMIGSNFERQPANYYPTPPWCVEALLKVWRPGGNVIWEPRAGAGNICQALVAAGFEVVASEKAEAGAYPEGMSVWPGSFVEDFLDPAQPRRCKIIITNPPYTIAPAFVRRAIDGGQHEQPAGFYQDPANPSRVTIFFYQSHRVQLTYSDGALTND